MRSFYTWLRAQVAAFNQRLAVHLTAAVGTMACAYLFLVLAILGFPGPHATAQAYVQWISQTVIQLVMLSVIMVGQRIMSDQQQHHHAENRRLHEGNAAQLSALQQQHDADAVRHEDMLTQLVRAQAALANQHDALHAKVDALTPPQPPPALAMPQRDASGRFVKARPVPTEGSTAA